MYFTKENFKVIITIYFWESKFGTRLASIWLASAWRQSVPMRASVDGVCPFTPDLHVTNLCKYQYAFHSITVADSVTQIAIVVLAPGQLEMVNSCSQIRQQTILLTAVDVGVRRSIWRFRTSWTDVISLEVCRRGT